MTPRNLPRPLIALAYARAAREYCEALPPEHFMEATAQATQREISLESLALVRAKRPDVHVFNELLILYPVPKQRKPKGVVPDNMVVVHDGPIQAEGSYDLPLQPAGPFWVLEYVSKSNQRKDYETNFAIYEKLKIPYYLTFYPDNDEMTLYRRNSRRYRAVVPDENGRCPIPELDLELGLRDGWVRYWYQGALLPLPAELQSQLDQVRSQLAATEGRLTATEGKLATTEGELVSTQGRLAVTRDELAAAQAQLEQERRERAALEAELARLRRKPNGDPSP